MRNTFACGRRGRFLALFMAVLMAFSLLPITALADDVIVPVSTAEELKGAIGSAEENTVIRLDAPITLGDPLSISGKVTIDLNNQTLSAVFDPPAGVYLATVKVEENGSLTLKGSGTLTAAKAATDTVEDYRYGVYVDKNASLTMQNSVSVTSDGASRTTYLVFLLPGSHLALKDNVSIRGGGVYDVGIKVASSIEVGSVSITTGGSITVSGGTAAISKLDMALSAIVGSGMQVTADGTVVSDLSGYPAESVKTFDFAPAPPAPPTPTEYSVTLPTGTGFTAAAADGSASPVTEGGSFSFTVSIIEGYQKDADFAVKANDTVLTETDGKYTIENITADQAVSVSGVSEIPAPLATYAVTLPTGTGFTAAAADGSASPVTEGGSFSFTVSIDEGYQKDADFAVKANDTVLTETDGKYTIENITADQAVTVSGVSEIPAPPATYAVTLPTGTGFTAAAADGSVSPVTEGGSFSFTVSINEGYQKDADFAVKANDTVLTETDGKYTIENITADQTVAVSGVSEIPAPPATYAVTLPEGAGFTAAAADGSVSPVTEGGSFSFTVSIIEGYQKDADFAVKANDTVLTETDGKYTIENITADQTVSVAGVKEKPAPLPAPATLAWSGNTAVWSGVTGAEHYGLQLYRNGAAVGSVVTVNGTTHDFTSAMDQDGEYTYTVFAAAGGVDGAVSAQSEKIIRDTGAPRITSRPASRTGEKTATFYFTSSEPGEYYFVLTANGSADLSADSVINDKNVNSGLCTAREQPISLTGLTDGLAKYIYLVVVDSHNNRSGVFRIEIPAHKYTVTLPTGTGFTAAPVSGSASPVEAGKSFSFTVTLASGYTKAADFAVKANGTALTDAGGVYTISNISANQTIGVTGVVTTAPTPTPTPAPVTYTVTLTTGNGFTLAPAAGSASPVKAGGSYSFTVKVANGYARGAAFAVKANGVTLIGNNGVYTISNINANQTVSVTGVVWSQVAGGGAATVPAGPTITTTLLPAATMGKAYSQQLTATGGNPITWSYTGTLPEGVTLSNTGLLSGTPTADGTFRFAVKASNTTGSATRQMSLVVTGTEYTVTQGANSNWTQGTEEGLSFQGSGESVFTVRIDGSALAADKYTVSDDNKTLTLDPEYLKTLSTGAHTLTLIYADGNAKAKFNIKAADRTIKPSITAQPQSMEANEGTAATFTVTASGTTPLLCQWQVDKNDGQGWTNITGAASASYTVEAVEKDQDGWQYRCVVTNAAGTAESGAATLTVKEALGDVTANTEKQPAKRNAGKVILLSVLGLAVAGLGGGLYLYFRRRSKYLE